MTNAKERIYLVDDDELVLETLSSVLFHAGYQVKTYLSAREFIAESDRIRRGCLIVDLIMPELGGLELQSLMQEKNIDVPVIFLSGAASIESAVLAMTKGAYTFLQKPVNNQELISAIRTAIEQHDKKQAQAAPAKNAKKLLNILSERELDIAILATEGLSAAAIGEKLFISARTVEAHKASIFNKLNINSIVQLTRLIVTAQYRDNK